MAKSKAEEILSIAVDALTAIELIVAAVKSGIEAKATPEQIRARVQAIRDKLAGTDTAVDAKIAKVRAAKR